MIRAGSAERSVHSKSLGLESPPPGRGSTPSGWARRASPVEYQMAVSGDDLHRALCTTVPATQRDRRPSRLRVLKHRREVREARALQARSSYLFRLAWRSRFVQSGIEPKAGDEGDGSPQMPATIQEFQGGIPTVGDGHDLSLWVPASYQQEHLPCPLRKRLVSSAPLLGVALGGSQRAQTNGKAHTREAHGTSARAASGTPI